MKKISIAEQAKTLLLWMVIVMIIHAIAIFYFHGFSDHMTNKIFWWSSSIGYYNIDLPFYISRWLCIFMWPVFSCLIFPLSYIFFIIFIGEPLEESDKKAALILTFGIVIGVVTFILSVIEYGFGGVLGFCIGIVCSMFYLFTGGWAWFEGLLFGIVLGAGATITTLFIVVGFLF